MGPFYANPASGAAVDPTAAAEALRRTVEETRSFWEGISEARASLAPAPGKWCAKQVAGHLVDSAVNNLQRVVRLQLDESIRLPGYRQGEWVAVQRYESRPWRETVGLWAALNLHLAHAIAAIQPEALSRIWHTPDEGDLTLGFVVADYLEHVEHHLRQIEKIHAGL